MDTSSTDQGRDLSATEVARELGLPPARVYDLARLGLIPAARSGPGRGGAWRFRREVVAAFRAGRIYAQLKDGGLRASQIAALMAREQNTTKGG